VITAGKLGATDLASLSTGEALKLMLANDLCLTLSALLPVKWLAFDDRKLPPSTRLRGTAIQRPAFCSGVSDSRRFSLIHRIPGSMGKEGQLGKMHYHNLSREWVFVQHFS